MLKHNFSIYRVSMLLMVILLHSSGCQSDQKVNAGYIAEGKDVPYALNQPDTTFRLQKQLREISGLSYYKPDQRLFGVNDELGILYEINKESGLIENEIKFGDKNDYEGVEIVGSIAYILESDGDLHVYDLSKQKALDKIENDLTDEGDLEGLGYDAKRKSLLLICKDRTKKQKKEDNSRRIYRVNINQIDVLEKYAAIDLSTNFKNLTVQGMSKGPFFNFIVMQRLRDFSPSAIAIRPSTGEIYVLSSRGGLLVVLEPDAQEVVSILFLKRNIHTQPEGICFDEYENLYISNEARGLPALLHVFKPTEDVVLVEDGKTNVIELFMNADSLKADSGVLDVDSSDLQ